MIYSEDPYLGITKPLPLFDSIIYPIDKDTYVEVQLYKKRADKYYEVVLHNNEISIYIGKFMKDTDLFGVIHKNGNILLYNENFNFKKRKMNIVEVLALYNIEDDTFYYCSQADAIRMFGSDIDLDGLKNPHKKILRTRIRKQIYGENKIIKIKKDYTLEHEKLNNNDHKTSKVLKLIK